MRELNAEELDRLVRSNRRLMISLTVTLAVIVGAVALLVLNDLDFVIRGGAGLGVLIGALLLIPHRRVVRDLGLTTAEARAVLRADREQRSGVAALSPAARAQRDSVRGVIWLVVGLVLLVVTVVAASYFFSKAGQTVEEDAPSDPWFGASFFGGSGALLVGIGALLSSSAYRHSAAVWRERAAIDPDDE